MRVTTIINLKGGVGKTITTLNMATILARGGAKVLIIDADPQANATAFCGLRDGVERNTLVGILEGRTSDPDDYIYETPLGIDCVPADMGLVSCDVASIRLNAMDTWTLDDFCSALEDEDAYDYVLIDCPPGFTAASVAAVYASNDVIVPVKVDAFALDGLSDLTLQINNLRTINARIRIAGALVTMWHSSPAVTEGETLLRQSSIPVFETRIRRSDKVDESTFMRRPLVDYSPRSSAARDYRDLVAEYIELGVQ